MTDNSLTARVEKLGLWRGEKQGFFFTTSDGKEFFGTGAPVFKEGQTVTLLFDAQNKLKNAVKAEIVSVEEPEVCAIKPTREEVVEAFTNTLVSAKKEVKDAKALIQEAMAKPRPSKMEEYLTEYQKFAKTVGGKDVNELWLSYRISCLEQAIQDYVPDRRNA